jgi:hypothetical protein
MASKMMGRKLSAWEEALVEMDLGNVSFIQARKIHDVTLAYHNPDTKYLPQDEMLDLLEKVTAYIESLPLGTNVTVREAIIAVGGDPSFRSTQIKTRDHLLDLNLLTHVPRNGEMFTRIEYAGTPQIEREQAHEDELTE